MSHKVVTLVCSRVVGSAAQKAVLVNMADKASDGGEGVFASKATIAAETEMGLTTVKRAISDLVARGIISEVGQRVCANGHTVIYDLNIGAISKLPEWKSERSSLRTRSTADPVQSGRGPARTVTPSRTDPHPVHSGPQTVLEPSLNQDDDDRVGEPDDFRGKILEAIGIDPDDRTALGGPAEMAEARRWLDLPHVTEGLICEQIRAVMARKGDGLPHSLAYFTAEMQRLSGELEAAKTPLAPAPIPTARLQDRPRQGGAVPMAPRPAKIDLDALASLWVPAVRAGGFVPASAIGAALARHMVGTGQVTAAELRRVGVAI